MDASKTHDTDKGDYLPVLKRVGLGLILLGVVDVGVMIYSVVQNMGYASSFNIFSIAAGAFLMRGNLRATSIVTFFLIFFLAAFVCQTAISLVVQPWGLVSASIHLHPFDLIYRGFILAVLIWCVWNLTKAPILQVCDQNLKKIIPLYTPALLGIILPVLGWLFVGSMLDESTKEKIIQEARHKLNGTYSYYISSVEKNHIIGKGSYMSATVVVWNDKDLREIKVRVKNP